MSTLHRIALLGFSAFERKTMASYFRLAGTREPRYELVPMLPEADFFVADADNEPSVQLVMAVERLPEAVFVGARAPEGAVAWLARPIDPMRVLRELDALAIRRQPRRAVQAKAGAADPQRGRTVIQPVRPQRPDPPAALLAPPPELLDLILPDLGEAPASPGVAAMPAAMPAPTPPAPAARATVAMPMPSVQGAAPCPSPSMHSARGALPSTALLVDDSDLALRFLQTKLAPFGLVTDCASHSEAAIKRLAERRYDFVFLDMELGEKSALDGLGLCQRIKRDSAAANVVMVTAHHTELDRVRGALAGCDGFLGKPLDEEELALYLARHGVQPAVNAGCAPS